MSRSRSTGLRVRTRMALWCAGLVVVAGAVVAAATLVLVQHTLDVNAPRPSLTDYSTDPVVLRSQQFALIEADRLLVETTVERTRNVVVLGLLVLTLLALAVGWWVAGRMLRPTRDLLSVTQRINASTMGHRVRADGPDDELKALADSFDAMVDRLEESFARQRRFVADVSHELRTPFAALRAQVDVALQQDRSGADLARTLQVVGGVVDRGTALVNAMLALSRADALSTRERVDLAGLAAEVVTGHPGVADLDLHADLAEAEVIGDPVLLGQLLDNLVGNAVRYNRPGGRLDVAVARQEGEAVLVVTNDGDVVSDDEAAVLVDRFRRGATGAATSGFGLGLSIVAAIVAAHDGRLEVAARPSGGLRVRVALPSAP